MWLINPPSENDSLASTEKKHGDKDVVVGGGSSGSGSNHNADHRTVD